MLSAGQGQTLTVIFTPADPANYNSVTVTVRINVTLPPTPAVTVHGALWQTCKLSHHKKTRVLVVSFSDALDQGGMPWCWLPII